MVQQFQRRRQVQGGDQFDTVEPFPGMLANTQSAISTQTVYAFAVRVSRPVTITKLSVYTNTTGANIDFAVLDSSYTKLVGISAAIASVVNGLATGTLTAAFTFDPGVTYFLAFLSDNAVPTVRGFSSGQSALSNVGTIKRAVFKGVGANAIPASFVTPTDMAGATYAILGHN